MESIVKKSDYDVLRSADSNYPVYIIENSCEPPTSLLKDIENDLSSLGISGEIIIDSLLYNGNNQERFISAYFNGNKFDSGTFKFIEVDNNNILRKLTSEYFRKNISLIEYSILNNHQKKLIIHGCDI